LTQVPPAKLEQANKQTNKTKKQNKAKQNKGNTPKEDDKDDLCAHKIII